MKILHKDRYQKVNFEDVGKIFNVHNGKGYIRVKVQSKMINHKFGEFAKTRKTTNKRTKQKDENSHI